MLPKSPPAITSPLRPSVAEVHSPNDLGDPLSDEEDPTADDPTEELNPVPEAPVFHHTPTDKELVIKSEPVDDVGGSTCQGDLPLSSFQLVEHSYSFMEHINLPSGEDRYHTLPLFEIETLSRTSGLKYAGSEEYTQYIGEDIDGRGIDVVVQLRKKRAPPITNRLIIPVLRVARSALTERNLPEDVTCDMDSTYNDFDRRDVSSGEFP